MKDSKRNCADAAHQSSHGMSIEMQARSRELFGQHQSQIFNRTDHIFAWLMIAQWAAGILAALWISPRTWAGSSSEVNPHVWVALLLGGALTVFPVLMASRCPGRTLTRHVIAIGQMLMSGLLIHLMGGRIEAHFHVFGSLAFLAFYRDWRVLITASVVVALDHLLRGVFWPQSVFGVVAGSSWRWLEHAGWVAFEDVFLIISIRQSLTEMLRIAERQAALERSNASIEATVAERTAELTREIAEHKRTEQDLRESEDRFRDLFENANDLIQSVAPDGRFLYVNRAWKEALGYTEQDLAHLTVFDIWEESRRMHCQRIFEGLTKGEVPARIETVFVGKHGQCVVVEGTANCRFENGQPVATRAIFRDITARKQADEELKRRTREAALHTDVAIALTQGGPLPDTLQNCAQAMVKHLDVAFARIWTLNPKESVLELRASAGLYTHLNGPHSRVPVGKLKIGLIAAERKPHLTNTVIGDPRVGDQDWAKREGMVAFAGYPLVVGGRVTGVLAMFARQALSESTLTSLAAVADGIALGIERKWAESALQESEGRFRELADNINDVFWMSTPDMRQMIYASPAYEKIWGRSLQSLYLNPLEWLEAIVPEDRQSVLDACGGLATEQASYRLDYRIIRPDGSMRWIHDRGFQIRDDQGRLCRTAGLASDITEQKIAEASMEDMHKKLVETSRQAGMAVVATSVLHNVGNVLNSVNVSAEVIARKLRHSQAPKLARVAAMLQEHSQDLPGFLTTDPAGRELPEYLTQLAEQLAAPQQAVLSEMEALTRNIEHIKAIVARQQSYARSSGLLESLSIKDVLEDAIRINAAAFNRHGIHLVRDFSPVPPCVTDRHMVMQILVNLLANAKYALSGSLNGSPTLTVQLGRNGDDSIKILVRDNGVGIAPENLTRIFEHGFTTRKDGHGFGLHSGALAARQLGGTLTAQSEGLDKGAVFTLELPLQSKPNSL